MSIQDAIKNYIKSGETKCQSLGVEIEHFVVDKRGYPISFDKMSKTINRVSEDNGFAAIVSDGYVVGCECNDYVITLEPSCQFEISIKPINRIDVIERIYHDFYELWEPEFVKLGYNFITKGYLPLVEQGLITPDDLELSPKKRYEYMDRYFQDTGRCGRYMMRASASAQVSVDYSSEADLVRKLRLLSKISPILMIMYENKTIDDSTLPGLYDKPHLFRTQQWDDLDDDRTGFMPGLFSNDFGYNSITDTMYNLPLILLTKSEASQYVGDSSAGHLVDRGIIAEDTLSIDETREIVEHILSMGFFHLRVKTYIEIRIVDSLPIDRALSLVALLKGIMYSLDNMTFLERELSHITTTEKIQSVIEDIEQNGLDTIIYNGLSASEWSKRLIELARKGLTSDEKKYL